MTTAPHEAWKRNIRGRSAAHCREARQGERESWISASIRNIRSSPAGPARPMYNSPGWSIRLIRPMADRAPPPRPTAAPFTGRAAAPCRRGRPNMYIRRPAGNRPAGAGTVRRWWLFCFAWGLPQPFFWRERLLTHCAAAAPRAGVPRPERCPALPSRIFPRTRTAGSPRWRLPGGDCQDRWPQRGMHQCI